MKRAVTIVVCILLIFSLGFVLFQIEDDVEGKVIIQDDTMYITHTPIRINSNAGFGIGINGVIAGDGSAGNPWMISGWDISGAGYNDCIYVANTTQHFKVIGCNLRWASPGPICDYPYSTQSGLYIYNATNCSAVSNMCTNNEGCGIYLFETHDISLDNNTMAQNGGGRNLRLDGCVNVTMTDNKLTGNGIQLYGLTSDSWISHNIDTTNTVDGKPILYWSGVSGTVVPAGMGQIILANCSLITVENQDISTLQMGMIFAHSSDITVKNNVLRDNSILYTWFLTNSEISNNTFITGRIYLDRSWDNIVQDNIIEGGIDYGISISVSLYGPNHILRNVVSNITSEYGWGGGICVSNSDDTLLQDNILRWNTNSGCRIDWCNRVTLIGNTLVGNGVLMGGYLEHWTTHIIDSSNTVNGKIIAYGRNQAFWSPTAGCGQAIAANCTNVMISNQNFSHSTVGVQLFECENATFTNVVSSNQSYGLSTTNCHNVTVNGGVYNYNNRIGISISNANNTEITGARASHNGNGIEISLCANATISGVEASNNTYNAIILQADCTEITIIPNNYTIRDCILAGNEYGLRISFLDNSSIINNTVTDCHYGVLLYASTNNTFISNHFENNMVGITAIYDSNDNAIADNLFFNNYQAIQLQHVLNGNKIYHNEFILNERPVVDDGINFWDDGYPSGGNYWSDYNGKDVMSGIGQNLAGSDGLGDTPYWNILNEPGANQPSGDIFDAFPIMTPSVDLEPPVSHVLTGEAYWHNGPTTITANCTDEHNTADEALLWYRYSLDNGTNDGAIWPNTTWSNWTFYDSDGSAPWGWSFDFPDGDGYYEFYSLSVDSEGNNETLSKGDWYQPEAEAKLGCDLTAPFIILTSHANNSYVTPGDYIRCNFYDNESHVETCNWTMNDGEATGSYAEIDTTHWSDRHYYINVTAQDFAGNVGFKSFEFDVDTKRPTLISTTPSHGAFEVYQDSTVIIEFSEAMNTTSVEDALQFTPDISFANRTWNAEHDILTMVSAVNLVVNTTYTGKITTVAKDSANNILSSEYTWTFTTQLDTDGDGILDVDDADDDNDGTPDADDAFPLDSKEITDTDSDGTGDNADEDDDNDDVDDVDDAFPLDPSESLDTDEDGIGNNADTDDDGDGVLDGDDFDRLDPNVTEDPNEVDDLGIGQYWWIIVILVIVPIVGVVAYLMRKRQAPKEPEPVKTPDEPPEETG